MFPQVRPRHGASESDNVSVFSCSWLCPPWQALVVLMNEQYTSQNCTICGAKLQQLRSGRRAHTEGCRTATIAAFSPTPIGNSCARKSKKSAGNQHRPGKRCSPLSPVHALEQPTRATVPPPPALPTEPPESNDRIRTFGGLKT